MLCETSTGQSFRSLDNRDDSSGDKKTNKITKRKLLQKRDSEWDVPQGNRLMEGKSLSKQALHELLRASQEQAPGPSLSPFIPQAAATGSASFFPTFLLCNKWGKIPIGES